MYFSSMAGILQEQYTNSNNNSMTLFIPFPDFTKQLAIDRPRKEFFPYQWRRALLVPRSEKLIYVKHSRT